MPYFWFHVWVTSYGICLSDLTYFSCIHVAANGIILFCTSLGSIPLHIWTTSSLSVILKNGLILKEWLMCDLLVKNIFQEQFGRRSTELSTRRAGISFWLSSKPKEWLRAGQRFLHLSSPLGKGEAYTREL